MSDKELYKQMLVAKLEEWKADLDKLKAKAKGADAGVQLKMKDKIASLDNGLQKCADELSKLDKAGNDAWLSLKHDLDSTWDSLKTAFKDIPAQFRE